MTERTSTGLSIDWETADKITVLNLKDCVRELSQEIETLEDLMDHGDLSDSQREDYMNMIGNVRAMTKVLKYFGVEE